MGAACAMDFYVTRPSDGSVQRSILFDDLRKLTNNDRGLSKKYYFLGKNKEFLDKYGKDAKFDENGEITVNSLIKLAGIDIHEDKILNTLNKDIGAGVMQYDDAIHRLQKFNRTSTFNDDYMATLIPAEEGKYDLQVVKKTTKNQEALNDIIRKQSLQNRIIYNLRQKGVNVEFIEKDGRERGRYSTENAEKTADGLWSIIRVMKGDNITPTLAQEAGHFAVGALGNDPLVQRLRESLTPETITELTGENDITILGKDPQREMMGRLVGQAIMNDGNNRNPLFKLAKRIWNKAKKLFFEFVEDDVRLAVMNAKATAEQIAQGFMSPDFMGNVETALNFKETLYDADHSAEVVAFKQITNHLKLMAEEMKNIFGSKDRGSYQDFYNIAADSELGVNLNDTNVETQVVNAMGEIIMNLQDLMVDTIPRFLAEVDLNDVHLFEHTPQYAKRLRAVHRFCEHVSFIETAITHLSYDTKLTYRKDGRDVSVSDIAKQLGQAVKDNLVTRCYEKEYRLFLNYLTEFYGKDYVERSARVVFNLKRPEPGKPNEPLIKKIGSEKVSLSEALQYLNNDISFLNRWVTSMADNPDIIGQLADKISKFANKRADDMTNAVWDRLRMMEKTLISGKLGTKDTRMFCEVDDDGNITGNYLSRVKFWKWEEDYNDYIREKRIDFYVDVFDTVYNTMQLSREERDRYRTALSRAENDTQKRYMKRNFGREIVSTWTQIQRANEWNEYMHGELKKFHDKYSVKEYVVDPMTGQRLTDEDGNELTMYVPKEYEKDSEGHDILSKPVYHSAQWDEVVGNKTYGKEREQFINQLRAIKMELDSYLPVNANRVYRMPMFRGTFIERMKNRMQGEEGSTFMGAVKDNLRENIINTFTINSDDTEYGSAQTYNTEEDTNPEENLFGDLLASQVDKIQRIPFFGINKLKDRDIRKRRQIRKLIAEQENGNTENAELLRKLQRQSVNEVSTDLLQSMLAYASMAHTYKASSSIVDILEVGRDVLEERDAKSKDNRKRGRSESYAYGRYGAFMEKQVYSIGVTRPEWDRFNIARKIAQGLSAISSKVFLGGNLAGGIVNTGTGAIEIFKESMAGEFFTFDQLWDAYKIYQKCGLDSILHAGQEFKDDDVSLIIRHFNILGESRQRQRTWDTSNKGAMRINNLLQGSAWAPYKTGDHFMQTMSYILTMITNYVVDKDGNRMTLLDMYRQNIVTEEVDGQKIRRIKWKAEGGFEDAVYYHDRIDRVVNKSEKELNGIAGSLLQKVRKQVKREPDERVDIRATLTADEKDLLVKYRLLPTDSNDELLEINPDAYERLEYKLTGIYNDTMWSQRNESDVMDMCREINNQMHGVYNRQDKVAFQQNIFGNMILTMRGYALGMASRRFSGDKYNIATGRDFEGSMVTAAKAILSTFSYSESNKESAEEKRHRIWTTWRAILFPYSPGNKFNKTLKEDMIKLGWSETQFANLRRNNIDFLVITALFLLRMLSAGDTGAGEDNELKKRIAEMKKDKKDGMYVDENLLKEMQERRKELKEQRAAVMNNSPMGIFHYWVARWFREQIAFNTPTGMKQEGNSLLAWMPSGVSLAFEMADAAYLGLGALLTDETDSRFYYQRDDTAGGRYQAYDTRFGQKIYKYIPYYRTYKYVWKRPYEALQSYVFNIDRNS